MISPHRYRVIAPYRRQNGIRALSYPPRGHRLYTRDEAVEVMRKLVAAQVRACGQALPDLEPWAESEIDRFDLTMVQQQQERTNHAQT